MLVFEIAFSFKLIDFFFSFFFFYWPTFLLSELAWSVDWIAGICVSMAYKSLLLNCVWNWKSFLFTVRFLVAIIMGELSRRDTKLVPPELIDWSTTVIGFFFSDPILMWYWQVETNLLIEFHWEVSIKGWCLGVQRGGCCSDKKCCLYCCSARFHGNSKRNTKQKMHLIYARMWKWRKSIRLL